VIRLETEAEDKKNEDLSKGEYQQAEIDSFKQKVQDAEGKIAEI